MRDEAMIERMDIRNPRVAEQVLNLQRSAYMIEAELIGYSDLPPLKDTIEALQQCGTFYGYLIQNKLCGAIAFKTEGGVIDIYRLMVHPDHFKKEIAKMLLNVIESENRVKKIIVSTASNNTPAVQFYIKHGFQVVKDEIINDRLSLTHFEKML